ncbi:MAG: ASCH domain-containing protein [Anaerolineae bacterium]|nr:ASCH domain-containing protein [Anaerolineae bacterium]
MNHMRLLPEFIASIRSGRKHATIRQGKRRVSTGKLQFASNDDAIAVHVHTVRYTTFAELSNEDAVDDGFDTLADLQNTLRRFYPTIQDQSPITVIEFVPL